MLALMELQRIRALHRRLARLRQQICSEKSASACSSQRINTKDQDRPERIRTDSTGTHVACHSPFNFPVAPREEILTSLRM